MYAVMFRMKESMTWTYATKNLLAQKKEIEKYGYKPSMYLNGTKEDADWVYKEMVFEKSGYLEEIKMVRMSGYDPTVEYEVVKSQQFK